MVAKASKNSRKLVVLSLLFLPFVFVVLLRCKFSPHDLIWQFQFPRGGSNSTRVHAEVSLRRLVRGKARRELLRNGVTCISDVESDICIATSSVRIAAAAPATPATVYLTAGQLLPLNLSSFHLRPYARKTDAVAMERTSPVRLLSTATAPVCDFTHSSPAVVFSSGGFAGNFFHDINDVIIPLFLTAGGLRRDVHLVVTDYESWWVDKYSRVLSQLSSSSVIMSSSNSTVDQPEVHCFPAAVIGLKYHGNLACNATVAPGGVTIHDFRRFFHASLSLNSAPVEITSTVEKPVLVLLTRRKSRMLVNENEVIQLAKVVGFQVELATPARMSNVQEFAKLVNNCSVLMGVHGAGMTNMVFMRPRAVLLQIVPWGLDWASAAYYGRPAATMGLRYQEYHIEVEESTLYEEYPRDHPVLADPWSINLQGYNVSKPVYTDGQNVRLNLDRFRETLVQVHDQLTRTPVS